MIDEIIGDKNSLVSNLANIFKSLAIAKRVRKSDCFCVGDRHGDNSSVLCACKYGR